MLSYYHTIRNVAGQINRAVHKPLEAFRLGRIEHEPAYTDRMLGAIEGALDGYVRKGIIWHAKTLTDRGSSSQEKKFGADFMIVLEVDLPEFKVAKGFLAQAKMVRKGSLGDLRELKRQCESMLNLSNESYVFLYRYEGVIVLPAISVLACNGNPLSLYHRSAQRFFEDHLECFVGDRNIHTANARTLDELAQRYEARRALLMQGKAID